MKQFLETMKQVALNAAEASKPMCLVFGTVTAKSPLKILLATQQELEKQYFLALAPVPDFKVGDELVLLREQGGQRFLILGKKGAL